MVDRDLENFSLVMKNYSQAILTFKQQEDDDKKKLESFLSEMKTVFEFIDSIDYSDTEQLLTKRFDPSNLATSVMLIADASPRERWILKQYRTLLLNRLNSYTKNRKLIYDILVYYFMQFLNCLEDHAGNMMQLRQLMLLSALGIQTNVSQSFVEFIQGPLKIALAEKKRELERATGTQDAPSWKQNTIG